MSSKTAGSEILPEQISVSAWSYSMPLLQAPSHRGYLLEEERGNEETLRVNF